MSLPPAEDIDLQMSMTEQQIRMRRQGPDLGIQAYRTQRIVTILKTHVLFSLVFISSIVMLHLYADTDSECESYVSITVWCRGMQALFGL